MKRLACVAMGALAALAVQADVTLTGETEYGAAQTIGEKITGTGSIRKTGTGTLVLSNGANDFSGGVAIEEGIVNGTVSGAFGRGTIAIGAKGASAYFGAKGASGTQTFANPITLAGGTGEGLVGEGGNTDGLWSLFFLSDGRLTGDVTATRNFRIRVEPTNANPEWSAGPNATFDGAVDASGQSVFVDSYGTITFNGPIKAKAAYFADQWSAGGRVCLASSDNVIGASYLGNERLICMAANVLGGGGFFWKATGGFVPGRASVDLNGYDQRVQFFSFALNTPNKEWREARWLTGDLQCFKSSSPATLTLTGCAGEAPVEGYATLRGAVSLLVDAKEHPAFVQQIVNGASTMTGSLTVSNGTLEVIGTARFADASAVTVGPSGTLVLAREKNTACFESVRTLTVAGELDASAEKVVPFGPLATLTLGPDARVRLPEGSVVFAETVIVDGDALALGPYDASTLPQVEGGTVVCCGTSSTAATWTAAGADATMSNPANWTDAVDVRQQLTAPVFAAAGTQAIVTDRTVFDDVTFAAPNGEAGFSLVRATAGAGHLYLAGDVTAVASAVPHRYEIDVPTTFISDVTVTAAGGQTNVFKNALGAGGLVKRMTFEGGGGLVFDGTNILDGALVTRTNMWMVSGLLGTPGHADQGEPAKNGPRTITIQHGSGNPAFSTRGVVLNNGVIEKPLYLDNQMGVSVLATRPGTTNELRGKVRFADQNGAPYGSWQPVEVGAQSELVFSGGAFFSHSFRPYGNGVVRFRTKPITAPYFAGLNPQSGTVVLEVAGNSFTNICLGYKANRMGNCRVEMVVSGAMTNGNLLVGINGGAPSVPTPDGLASWTHTVDLNATTQRCAKVAVSSVGYITGDYPAMLDVFVGARPNDPAGYCVAGFVTGGAGFRMSGPNENVLLLTNRVFASCGDLEVVSGTMAFAHNAAWPNGTNVTVGGTGTLRLGQSKTFDGRHARLFLSGSGRLSLPEGVSQAFADVFVDGVRLGAGTYTAATLPSRVVGAGSFRVVGRATLFIVR